jgi:hypothetical protein
MTVWWWTLHRLMELFDETHALPIIKNNERVVSGDDIPVYLKELTKLMHDWQLFQNHCCSVDDGGDSW